MPVVGDELVVAVGEAAGDEVGDAPRAVRGRRRRRGRLRAGPGRRRGGRRARSRGAARRRRGRGGAPAEVRQRGARRGGVAEGMADRQFGQVHHGHRRDEQHAGDHRDRSPAELVPPVRCDRARERLARDRGGHRGGVLGGRLQRPCPAAGGAHDEDLADGRGPVERRGVEGGGDARHDGAQGGADERAGDPEERGRDRGRHRGEGAAGDLGDAQPERLGACGAGASAADSAATRTEPVAGAGGPDGERGVGRGSVRGSGMAPDGRVVVERSDAPGAADLVVTPRHQGQRGNPRSRSRSCPM